MSSVSEILANYYHNLDFDALSEEVINKAKQCVLDYLGCAIGAVNMESSNIVKKCFLPGNDCQDGCNVILTGQAPVEKAAFINAVFSHSLEMDDLNYGAGGHPAVSIMPAAMAMAEKKRTSGRELLKAIIIAYDLMYRIGQAGNPESMFERGLHPTSINGTFAAAIAAANLMGLEEKKVANALGIAGSFTSGNLECYTDGSLTKRINPGVAAQGGIMSAILASEGFTGPRFIFEGRSGFLVSYTDKGDSKKLTENLDYKHFGIMATSFKPYACCRYNHSPIYATLKLVRKYNLDYRDVEKVNIKVVGMAVRGVCEPREVKYDPKNLVDAQFSLPYSIAVALINKRVFIEEYTEEMLHDSRVRDLMTKIEMEHDPTLDDPEQKSFPAISEIYLKDGRKLVQKVDYCIGDPEDPMDQIQLEEKFISLSKLTMSDRQKIQGIIDVVSNLENVEVSNLITVLQTDI